MGLESLDKQLSTFESMVTPNFGRDISKSRGVLGKIGQFFVNVFDIISSKAHRVAFFVSNRGTWLNNTSISEKLTAHVQTIDIRDDSDFSGLQNTCKVIDRIHNKLALTAVDPEQIKKEREAVIALIGKVNAKVSAMAFKIPTLTGTPGPVGVAQAIVKPLAAAPTASSAPPWGLLHVRRRSLLQQPLSTEKLRMPVAMRHPQKRWD